MGVIILYWSGDCDPDLNVEKTVIGENDSFFYIYYFIYPPPYVLI